MRDNTVVIEMMANYPQRNDGLLEKDSIVERQNASTTNVQHNHTLNETWIDNEEDYSERLDQRK